MPVKCKYPKKSYLEQAKRIRDWVIQLRLAGGSYEHVRGILKSKKEEK